MRPILAVGLFTLAFLAFAGVPAYSLDMSPEDVQTLLEHTLPASPEFVPGEIIVKMKPDFRASASTLTRLGVRELETTTSGGEIIYRIPPSISGTLAPAQVQSRTMAILEEVRSWDGVEYAQPNYILRIAARIPNDSRYRDQWHYFTNGTAPDESPGGISLPGAWDQNIGDDRIVIAIIDTGILPDHEDIRDSSNQVGGFDMISDPGRANDGDGRDRDPTDSGDGSAFNECFPGSPPQSSSWHGTHVAGTVGVGKTNNQIGVAGINWNAKVQSVRVLGKCGGTTVDINDGIRWAAGLPVPGVPSNPTPAKVINMSLGGRGACSLSPSTQAAIDEATARNVTVVVAAGNEASDASGFFPASCDNVIGVAASDYRGHLVTRYSNFGDMVDLLAPGGDVSRDDNGDNQNDGVLSMVQGGYARFNGTSMAAPHVAGAAALLLAQDPGLTPAQLLVRLRTDALPRSSTQCPRPCGAGLIQLASAGSTPPEPPPPPSVPPPPPPDTPNLTLTGLGFLIMSMVMVVLLRRRWA